MKSFSREAQTITDINVTPLVDITLVLLIIFMATAPIINRKALNVDVPQTAQGEVRASKTLPLFLTRDRTIVLDGASLDVHQLETALRRRVAENPFQHVSISADRGIPYEEVVALLDVVRSAGVKRAGLDVHPKSLGAPLR